jgi:hypothetical protein
MPSCILLHVTLQGMHGTILSIHLSALSHACMGIQPHGHERPTLTDESASMRPPLSLTCKCASPPTELIAHESLGKIMKERQGSLSNRFVYNPKGLPCYRYNFADSVRKVVMTSHLNNIGSPWENACRNIDIPAAIRSCLPTFLISAHLLATAMR